MLQILYSTAILILYNGRLVILIEGLCKSQVNTSLIIQYQRLEQITNLKEVEYKNSQIFWSILRKSSW